MIQFRGTGTPPPSGLDVRSLRGRGRGRRAFILGNGPSVIMHDLSILRKELTIGMNASPILERNYGFTAEYYCVSDLRFFEVPEKRDLATKGLSPVTLRVLRSELAALDDPYLAPRTAYLPALGRDGFAADLSVGFFHGSTTALMALQLAYYLGCTEVVLLGCDYSYPPNRPRFYAEVDPSPSDPMVSVQVRNVAEAVRLLKRRGITVVNCSPVSVLRPYVPTASFASLFPVTSTPAGRGPRGGGGGEA